MLAPSRRRAFALTGLALAAAASGFIACSSDTSGNLTDAAGSATDGGGGGMSATTSSSGKPHTTSTTSTTNTTSTGSKASTSSAGQGGNGGSGGSGGEGGSIPLDPEVCHMCIDQTCATEKANCGDECYAVEACIEAQCGNLSALGSPTEGQCQVNCQSRHPTGKAAHLAYVNCSVSSDCDACSSNPFDVTACRAKADAGVCAPPLTDCANSPDCVDYQTCAAGCTTATECVGCGSGTEGQAGQALAFAYEDCIAHECLAEAWLP